MGQRTQILLVKENNEGKRQIEVYHNQWGYGRNMYLALMDCVIKDYGKNTCNDDYDFFKTHGIDSENWSNMTREIDKETIDNVNLDDIATVKDVFDQCDNNNGGMVIYVKEGKQKYNTANFKTGFLLGPEDCCDPFEEWASPQEYGENNGGADFSDDEFVEMFDKFCKYFDIEYICG